MKILVVRRDNIGDLVLTTPVFTALRRRYHEARIEELVNSYNAPAIEGHPDLDAVGDALSLPVAVALIVRAR